MPFPEVERVIYKINPLNRVICQLRFPPLLRIETEVPYKFQESLGEMFPIYEEKIEYGVDINNLIKNQYLFENKETISKPTNKNHEFSTVDGQWKVNLTKTFLSLSTSKYTRWENFIQQMETPYKALIDLYKPAFHTRIGLRYIDVFERSKLGLSDIPWDQLIQPSFLGLHATTIGDRILSFESNCEVLLADNESIVRIATSKVITIENKEHCFMVDSDFFYQKNTEIEKTMDKLNYLHTRASRLIRFVIKQKMHDAMQPEALK